MEAFDLYLARQSRGLDGEPNPLIDVQPGEKVRAYSERIARRFMSFVPPIYRIIMKGLESFPDANILSRRDGLDRIHDENDIGYIDSRNCVVATLAAQYTERSWDGTSHHFLQIDDRLYSHPNHSALSRAVLFLHEVVYSVARDSGHHDSLSTRTLVRSLISQEGVSTYQMSQLLRALKMPETRNCTRTFHFDSGEETFSTPCDDFLTIWARDQMQKMHQAAFTAADVANRSDELNGETAEKYNTLLNQYNLKTCTGRGWFGQPTGCTPLPKKTRLEDGTFPLTPTILSFGECESQRLEKMKVCQNLDADEEKACRRDFSDLITKQMDKHWLFVRDAARKAAQQIFASDIEPALESGLLQLNADQIARVRSLLKSQADSVFVKPVTPHVTKTCLVGPNWTGYDSDYHYEIQFALEPVTLLSQFREIDVAIPAI